MMVARSNNQNKGYCWIAVRFILRLQWSTVTIKNPFFNDAALYNIGGGDLCLAMFLLAVADGCFDYS